MSQDVPPSETSPLLPDAQDPDAKFNAHDSSNLWSDLWHLGRDSLPLIATYLLQYSFTVITTIVAGHLSSDDLAAASIGLTTMNIVGYSIVEGMATALDTLCAQAYGSGHVTGVGLHVQRMLLFMALAMIPIGAFWLCSPWILPAIIQQHHISLKAGRFLQYSLIGLPGYAFFEAGKRFLQAQGDFRTGMLVLIICTPVNVFLSWLLAIKLDMGLGGAALAQALANNLRPTLLLLYIVLFGEWSLQCWAGFSWQAFREWRPMVRLSLAGLAVNMAEWLAFEILTVSTSYIDTNHLAAQSILTTISVITWHIPFSISVVVSTRIGYFIGAGHVRKARRASVLYGIVMTVVGILDGTVLFLLRNQLSSMFSDDSAVRAIATDCMLVLAVFQVIDAINCGCNGVLRGLGRQSAAAWIVFAVNYLGAVPLAIWLELGSPDLKLEGAWMGIGIGMVLIAVIECMYMGLINWQDCVDSAQAREGI